MKNELIATYRLQVHAGFTLEDAAKTAPYLAELGISHIYFSPYQQAAKGSKHGYDVVNHQDVNPELGGSAAHREMLGVLKELGLGQVLDIVPNHMTTLTENPWWRDVLENGQSSRYSSHFDVEWDPPAARHSNVVLLPVLGDHYGRVLEAGEIRLAFEKHRFCLQYFDNQYPVDPRSISSLLHVASERLPSDELEYLAASLERLPECEPGDRKSAEERHRQKEVIYRLFDRFMEENPSAEACIQTVVDETNQDADTLDVLIELQNYRLAYWKMARRELGYRRFFDINTLIGLRMEDELVFHESHRLILEWIKDGSLDGLRIDHPDGLRNPGEYFQRLRAAGPETWIVIEKILEPGEDLPATWPVAGTTGYDFMNRVNGLFVHPASQQPLTDFYGEFTGRSTDWEALVHEKKQLAAEEVLGSDLNHLTALVIGITEKHRRYRDYGRQTLRNAISELATCLPVYRTYIQPETGEISAADQHYLDEAVEAAKSNRPDIEDMLFDFLRDLMLLRYEGAEETEFVLRFQQYSGPVMAKGVEDTAFYNYYRLISLNEVGGSPGKYGMGVEEFHQACLETQQHWPQSMLSTSTHDTKRSEDVRARLNVLTEIPEEWIQSVQHWSELNQEFRRENLPDRNDEYLLYQTLVGAWPIEEARVLQFMEKAIREAKVHTSWTNPNALYEEAIAEFVGAALQNAAFLQSLEAFVDKIKEAGFVNALSQTLIKLTSPGVPDIYQGSELWNFSLVDPDNRRPVDFARANELLREMASLPTQEIWTRLKEGLPKLWVIRRTLGCRRDNPGWFGPDGGYTPLLGNTQRVLAYLRGEKAAVVTPRFWLKNNSWGEEHIKLPPGNWKNVFTGESVPGGDVKISQLLGSFPVALLVLGE